MQRSVESAAPALSGAAFAAWIEPERAVLRAVACQLVGATDADDLVQDVLLQAWRHVATYDVARGSARAWLIGIMFRQSRRQRRQGLSGAAQVSATDIVDRGGGRLTNSERGRSNDETTRLWVGSAVRALPLRQRQVIALYYLADLPVAEISGLLGISAGTVKSQLADARATLRVTLGDHND